MLDIALLRSALEYDPETGVFRWRNSKGPIKAGQIAGSLKKDGYRGIQFRGREWGAHRLAWAYVHGQLPQGQLDHANLNKDDNRIANLRLSDQEKQQGNTALSVRNKSGFKGVSWNRFRNKWRAEIRIGGKSVYLGNHDTAEAASAAYQRAAKLHFGDHARF